MYGQTSRRRLRSEPVPAPAAAAPRARVCGRMMNSKGRADPSPVTAADKNNTSCVHLLKYTLLALVVLVAWTLLAGDHWTRSWIDHSTGAGVDTPYIDLKCNKTHDGGRLKEILQSDAVGEAADSVRHEYGAGGSLQTNHLFTDFMEPTGGSEFQVYRKPHISSWWERMSPDWCKRWFTVLGRFWRPHRPVSRPPPSARPAVDPDKASRWFVIAMILVPPLLLLLQLDRVTVVCASGGAGACALWAVGVRPELTQMLRWLQLERLTPLAAALCWNATVCDTGLYDLIACYAVKWRRSLVVCAVWASAAAGACADPVACTAVLTPLTIRVMEELQLDPRPVLVAASVLADLAAGPYERRVTGSVLMLCGAGAYFAVVFVLFQPHHYKEDHRVVELKQELLLWERFERALPTGSRAHALRRYAVAERNALLRDIECVRACTALDATGLQRTGTSPQRWKLHQPALLATQCALVGAFVALACWPAGLVRLEPAMVWVLLAVSLLATARLPLNCLAARLDLGTLLFFAASNFYGNVLVVLRFPEMVVQYIHTACVGRSTSNSGSLRSCAMFWVSAALTAGAGGGAVRPLAAAVRQLGASRGTRPAAWSYLVRTVGGADAAALGHAVGSMAGVMPSPGALASAAASAQQGYPLAGSARARVVLPLTALLLLLAVPSATAAARSLVWGATD